MKTRKHLFLIMLFLCIFIGMSCVSASDIDHTLLNEPTTTDDTPSPGTFDDLNNDIKNLQPGDTYNFDRDYYFDGSGKYVIVNPNAIIIDKDNITLNGNGHVIDAGGDFYAFFKITGNNVKILNLTFVNSKPAGPNVPINSPLDDPAYQKKYYDVSSPISWYGDKGIISDCTFINNEAINGGAICWSGNGGIINNCIFINNTAQGVGGAIYIGGENNTIRYSVFINSYGQLSREEVYLDRNRKNVSLVECAFETGGKSIVDGAVTNIDVNYLKYDVVSYMGDKKFNMVYILYCAIMNGGLNYIDNDISYYAQYDNETRMFTLSVIRYFKEFGVTYRKDYNFKDITELSALFDLMYSGSFKNDITLMLNKTVSSAKDYDAVRKLTASEIMRLIGEIIKPDIEGYLPCESVVCVLNVIFTEKLSIKCTSPWAVSISNFNIILVDGHGSTIYGTYDESDEYNWVIINSGYTFIASNLSIEGYNTAVKNMGGTCTFNYITFKQNRMNYYFTRDWGGAILSTGVVVCNFCNFNYNYAKHGGAIFTQGFLSLNNCTFSHNEAYREGNDVCVGDGGKVQFNGVNLTSNFGPVYFSDGFSVSDISCISLLCLGSTLVLSILAGAASGGMLMAAGIGLLIGAIHGLAAAKIVSDNVFNVNFDTTTYSAFIIGGSIAAGIAGGILGFTFFSEANACDYWCIRHMEGGPDYIFVDDSSSLSSSTSSMASDSSSVISGMIP